MPAISVSAACCMHLPADLRVAGMQGFDEPHGRAFIADDTWPDMRFSNVQRGDSNVTRKSIGERLAQLEARRKTLQIRLSKQERSIDTRRKVLIGALILHRLTNRDVQISGGLATWLRSELPKFLVRDADRQLFDDLLVAQAPTSGTQTVDSEVGQ